MNAAGRKKFRDKMLEMNLGSLQITKTVTEFKG